MAKEVVALRGGLNTSTDRSTVRPGQMTRCMNFEVMPSGVIRRALGYRRWSGGCYYGPPSFFIWGPYDADLQQGVAYVGEWGLPGGYYLNNEAGTWVDYGKLAPYTGRARLTYQFDWFGKADNYQPADPFGLTSGSVAVAMQGREPIRPERLTTPNLLVNNPINQTFGVYETWPSTARAVDAHEIIDRAWLAYWDQPRGQGLVTTQTANPGGVQSIPGYHPYGGIAGVSYWRDRLYVVADILSMTFANGTSAPRVGDVVSLDFVNSDTLERTESGWQWYVERVIVESGFWEDGTASGVILLVGGVPGAATNAYPPVLASPDWSSTNGRLLDDGTDFTSAAPGVPFLQNDTGSVQDMMRLVGYADPLEEGAALWRSTDLYDAPSGNAWERVDLGYEVPFASGDSAFVVVNRVSSDAYLDGDTTDGSPSVSVTEWRTGFSATIGGMPVSASGLSEDDSITVSLSSVIGGTDPRPRLSPVLLISNFDFLVPDYSIITGIEVEANCYVDTGTGEQTLTAIRQVSIQIGDTLYGNKTVAAAIPSATGTTYTFGGETDLWGATISPEGVSSPDFGIAFVVSDGAVIFDRVRVRIHYKPYVSTVYFRNTSDAAKSVTSLVAYSVCRFLPVAAVGSTVTVAGATPSGYNGTHTVIAKPSFVGDDEFNQYVYFIVAGVPLLANPVTGTVTVNGNTINENLMSRVGVQAIATVSAHQYLTGQYATIAGAVQTQYNGTFKILVNSVNTFTIYPTATPSASPATGTITATRNAVSEASAVWYYKDIGDWSTTDAGGILTIYDVSHPTEIGSGQQIRSGSGNDGTLYALTAGGAQRVYMASSKDLTRNKSRYEWLVANFTRSVVFEQLFGVSGAGFAFSFDGKFFIRIRTGLSKALDRPRHLAEHNFQLVLGYSFGDVAFSDLGFPESFSATFEGSSPASTSIGFAGGSTTVSVSDPVHGMLRLPEQSLAVFCENSIRRITGSGGIFTEQVVRPGHGITEYTARNVNGMVCFTDSLGIMLLRPTDLFGQLLPQYVSALIAEFISEAEASSLSGPRPRILFAHPFNNKNQYRLFFSDGSVVGMTMVGANMEPQFWVGQYDFVPFCVGSGVHSDRRQVQFAGHVYTANHLLPFGPGPGGQASQAPTYGMAVNPAWPFQLDVTSTWDTNAMPAMATFFLGDMAEKGGLHAIKRFNNVSMDVRAYGYAMMAAVFDTRFGEKVGVRVQSADFIATTSGRPVSVGDKQGGDYLNVQQYRTTVGANCAGEWLLLTVESDGARDYDAGQTDSDIRWLRPFEIGIAAVTFDLNRDANATETTALSQE